LQASAARLLNGLFSENCLILSYRRLFPRAKRQSKRLDFYFSKSIVSLFLSVIIKISKRYGYGLQPLSLAEKS